MQLFDALHIRHQRKIGRSITGSLWTVFTRPFVFLAQLQVFSLMPGVSLAMPIGISDLLPTLIGPVGIGMLASLGALLANEYLFFPFFARIFKKKGASHDGANEHSGR
jgi:hypothetical protein